MVGINTNTAALFAQRNLEQSSMSSELSIGRLSSGDRIIRAADDVSGLAVGTVLGTNVSTLKTILTSTSQANSLLSIADGGLKNIGDILQRQKSLAVSANTGALSDNERAYLDEEFQNLTSELDRIAGETNFNGIKLLDNSISGDATVTTAVTDAVGDYSAIGTLGTAVMGTLDLTAGGANNINNDSNFQGALNNFTGVFQADGAGAGNDYATLSVEVNGVVYNSQTEVLTGGDISATTFTFEANDGSGASFELTTKAGIVALTNQSDFDGFVSSLNADFVDIKIAQERAISSDDVGSLDGTILAGTTGDATDGLAKVVSYNHDVTNNEFGSITQFTGVASTGGGANDGQLSVTINGDVYTASNVADTLSGGDTITLTNYDADGNSTGQTMTLDFTGLTLDVDMTDQNQVNLVADALNAAFGSNNAALEFQVGTKSTDVIGMSLDGARSVDIFKDAAGNSVSLSIATAGESNTENGGDGTGAVLASNVLDRAINTITSLRASVGALQSRFDYATSNISTSIQNTEAARADFMDVDVAEESSKFATSQVKLQASISVLAQANQLPQNLLKLIG